MGSRKCQGVVGLGGVRCMGRSRGCWGMKVL